MEEYANEQGVFPSQRIKKAIADGMIRAETPIPDENIQPASLDLRLGSVAHRLRCSFLPEVEEVEKKLQRFSMGTLSLSDGAILEQNRPYLIPLQESLSLPASLWAKANPRSSTGRIDVFTRVITDGGHTFDEIQHGYQGRLYLEVVPLSFTIRVQEGLTLNQLRIIAGRPRSTDEEIRNLHNETPLLFAGPHPLERITLGNGLFLSIDLHGRQIRKGKGPRQVGFRAKRHSKLLDLTSTEPHAPDDFWERVHSEKGFRLLLEPNAFYLLFSAEAVLIPPKYAAEMTAYDPTSGELRTHYAGFFDPGFGYEHPDGGSGSRAALEVRAHDIAFMLEERQRLCRLSLERMLEAPDRLYGQEAGSSYQRQASALSKLFDRPTEEPSPEQLELAEESYN